MSTQKRISSGILCTYGYFRESETELKINIPVDIAMLCTYFVDIALKWLFSLTNLESIIIVPNHEIHNTEKIHITNNIWNKLTDFDKRLLMDLFLLNNDYFITEIECMSQNFGIEGIKWLGIYLKNASHPIQYVNLSNCNLDAESIQIIVEALRQNQHITNSIWLDLSNNKEIDDISTVILMRLLPKLNCLKLDNTNITYRSLEYLTESFKYFQDAQTEQQLTYNLLLSVKQTTIDQSMLSKWDISEQGGCLILEDKLVYIILANTYKVLDDNYKWSRDDAWNGIWRSEYGLHGQEFQHIYTALNKKGDKYVIARKVTGDPNVPSGKVTWFGTKIPRIKWSEKDGIGLRALLNLLSGDNNYQKVNGLIQLRGTQDINDEEGFYWEECQIVAFAEDMLIRVWNTPVFMQRVTGEMILL